jgi:hypothetical protein
VIPYVPAGTRTLVFETADEQQHLYYAKETVTVSSKNIEGMRVLVQPLATIAVNRVNAAGESVNLGEVELEPVTGNSENRYRAVLAPGDVYAIMNVPPGTYRTLVLGLEGQCMESLTSGNIDLTREPLTVAPGSQPEPINLSLANNCATLEVSIHSANTGQKATILLVPTSLTGSPSTVRVDDSGHAKFNDLAPGEYTVYAFTSIEGLEYRNPEVMRGFHGQPFTLSANQHAAVTVEAIEWKDQ